MIIDEALKAYNVIGMYSLFSGGHDSLVATHIAAQHPRFSGVIHINTGTGLPETLEFVERTCRKHSWPLIVKEPHLPYEALLMKIGFPGPAYHPWVYQRLKERPLRQVIKEIRTEARADRYAKVMLISGVREQESDRRAEIEANFHIDGSMLWIPLIADMTAKNVTDYIADHNLERSPVKDKIHMSGECFCGCFTRESELSELKLWYPEQYQRIARWRELVRLSRENQLWEYGQGFRDKVTIKENACKWGGPKGAHPPEQGDFFSLCFHCRQDMV